MGEKWRQRARAGHGSSMIFPIKIKTPTNIKFSMFVFSGPAHLYSE